MDTLGGDFRFKMREAQKISGKYLLREAQKFFLGRIPERKKGAL